MYHFSQDRSYEGRQHGKFNGHELGQIPGNGEGQGGLVAAVHGVARVGHNLVTEQQ